MDDEYGNEADYTAAAQTVERRDTATYKASASDSGPDRGKNATARIQQPKPQVLPSRAASSSILVSTRQKGNPILNSIRGVPWEYADTPADYILGATTCALFLSLKYHRLHPEYIYSRIRALAGKYNLRILLVMVDIENHEESLKELSKTSLINNVTIILCWSAQEAGRYLELYKTYEHAAPTSIRAHQSTSYSDKLVEFITVPRSINKTDAVGLVSNFGSIRTAINARPEEVALIAGWGEKKVQRWCTAVREPFRTKKAAKRVFMAENEIDMATHTLKTAADQDSAAAEIPNYDFMDRTEVFTSREGSALTLAGVTQKEQLSKPPRETAAGQTTKSDEQLALDHVTARVASKDPVTLPDDFSTREKRRPAEEELSEGMKAALARLRQG